MKKKFYFISMTVGFCSLCFFNAKLFAEVPSKFEAEYSEAVLAYNAKQYQKAITALAELEKKAPELLEALELEAMSYRALQDEKKVEELYVKLVKAKTKLGKPESELAPYHFELGMMRHKENKLEQAAKHFQFALKHNFNKAVCHLYLGLYSFQSGAWDLSEDHFSGVVTSGTGELKPIAYFYLGQTYGKTSYSSGATDSFISAKKFAKEILEDKEATAESKKMAKQIYSATTKSLAPYDHGQFFGNLSLLVGYDSNTLAIPASASDTTGKASAQNTLLVGFGYASSPLKTLQFVPNYRGTFNYNYNRNSSSSEFPTNTISLFLTIDPLSRFSYGIKGDGSLVFQNTSTSAGSRFKYSLYNTSASVGPYFKAEISPKVMLGGESTFQTRKFNNDGTGISQRSGSLFFNKLTLKNDAGRRWFNPSLALRADLDRAKGTEFSSTTLGTELADQIHVSDKMNLSATASFAFAKYPDHTSGARKDSLYSFEWGGSYLFKSKWIFLASLLLTKNVSNQADSFSYNRFTLSSGVSYSF